MQSIMTQRMASEKITAYGFSVDPESTVRALRCLANALEAKEVVLTRAVQYRVATHDDYEMCGVVLNFAERLPEPGSKIVELRGNGEMFPIDAVKVGQEGVS